MCLFGLRCSCLYTPSRDVPATFHIDLHFIANPMYYDSDKFEDLIACCYHTHIYCDSVLITWCFFLAVLVCVSLWPLTHFSMAAVPHGLFSGSVMIYYIYMFADLVLFLYIYFKKGFWWRYWSWHLFVFICTFSYNHSNPPVLPQRCSTDS